MQDFSDIVGDLVDDEKAKPRRWPIEGPVTSVPGDPRENGRLHAGTDIAAKRGTPVPWDWDEEGEVVFAGPKGGYGNLLEVRVPGRRKKRRYAHLDGFDVVVGDRVRPGQQIGRVGNTGSVRSRSGGDGSHLHYEEVDDDTPDQAPAPADFSDLVGDIQRAGGAEVTQEAAPGAVDFSDVVGDLIQEPAPAAAKGTARRRRKAVQRATKSITKDYGFGRREAAALDPTTGKPVKDYGFARGARALTPARGQSPGLVSSHGDAFAARTKDAASLLTRNPRRDDWAREPLAPGKASSIKGGRRDKTFREMEADLAASADIQRRYEAGEEIPFSARTDRETIERQRRDPVGGLDDYLKRPEVQKRLASGSYKSLEEFYSKNPDIAPPEFFEGPQAEYNKQLHNLELGENVAANLRDAREWAIKEGEVNPTINWAKSLVSGNPQRNDDPSLNPAENFYRRNTPDDPTFGNYIRQGARDLLWPLGILGRALLAGGDTAEAARKELERQGIGHDEALGALRLYYGPGADVITDAVASHGLDAINAAGSELTFRRERPAATYRPGGIGGQIGSAIGQTPAVVGLSAIGLPAPIVLGGLEAVSGAPVGFDNETGEERGARIAGSVIMAGLMSPIGKLIPGRPFASFGEALERRLPGIAPLKLAERAHGGLAMALAGYPTAGLLGQEMPTWQESVRNAVIAVGIGPAGGKVENMQAEGRAARAAAIRQAEHAKVMADYRSLIADPVAFKTSLEAQARAADVLRQFAAGEHLTADPETAQRIVAEAEAATAAHPDLAELDPAELGLRARDFRARAGKVDETMKSPTLAAQHRDVVEQRAVELERAHEAARAEVTKADGLVKLGEQSMVDAETALARATAAREQTEAKFGAMRAAVDARLAAGQQPTPAEMALITEGVNTLQASRQAEAAVAEQLESIRPQVEAARAEHARLVPLAAEAEKAAAEAPKLRAAADKVVEASREAIETRRQAEKEIVADPQKRAAIEQAVATRLELFRPEVDEGERAAMAAAVVDAAHRLGNHEAVSRETTLEQRIEAVENALDVGEGLGRGTDAKTALHDIVESIGRAELLNDVDRTAIRDWMRQFPKGARGLELLRAVGDMIADGKLSDGPHPIEGALKRFTDIAREVYRPIFEHGAMDPAELPADVRALFEDLVGPDVVARAERGVEDVEADNIADNAPAETGGKPADAPVAGDTTPDKTAAKPKIYTGPEKRSRPRLYTREETAPMSKEQMEEVYHEEATAARLHELTGIPNRLAYEEARDGGKLKAVQISIDMRALKLRNDTVHPSFGDTSLDTVARILMELSPETAYHLKGDEFAAGADTEAGAIALMDAVQKRLNEVMLEARNPETGVIRYYKGIDLHYETGPTLDIADAALNRAKKLGPTDATGRVAASDLREVDAEGNDLPGAAAGGQGLRPGAEGVRAAGTEGLAPEAAEAVDSIRKRQGLVDESGTPTTFYQLPPYAQHPTGLPEVEKARMIPVAGDPDLKTRPLSIANLDALRARFPNPLRNAQTWLRMYATMGAKSAAALPRKALEYVKDPSKLAELLNTMNPEQIAKSAKGFEEAAIWQEAMRAGLVNPDHVAKAFLWGMLSRKLSPYPHENAFVNAVTKGVTPFINDALNGKFDLAKYDRWSKNVSNGPLTGTEGAGAQNNLNDFGKYFLTKMSQKVEASHAKALDQLFPREGGYAGQSRLAILHGWFTDTNLSGRDIRRRYNALVQGAGVDNKVVSFALLATGRTDVLVLDRVQLAHLFDTDRQFPGLNGYDGLPTGTVQNLKGVKTIVPPEIQTLLDAVSRKGSKLKDVRRLLRAVEKENATRKQVTKVLKTHKTDAEKLIRQEVAALKVARKTKNPEAVTAAKENLKAAQELLAEVKSLLGSATYKKIELVKTGMWEVGSSTRGLAIYEALEDGLSAAGQKAYDMVGRGADFSLGRLHWDTWVARSAQEVDHGSLPLILDEAIGKPNPYVGATVSEGKYDTFKSGVKTVFLGKERGTLYVVETSDGVPYVMDGRSFDQWQREITRIGHLKKGGFVDARPNAKPGSRFQISEQVNKWYRAEGNRDQYDAVLKQFGRRPTDRENVYVEPTDGGRLGGVDQDAARADGRVEPLSRIARLRAKVADLKADADRTEAAVVARSKAGTGKKLRGGRQAGDVGPIAADLADLLKLGEASVKRGAANVLDWTADFLETLEKHFGAAYAAKVRPFAGELYQRLENAGVKAPEPWEQTSKEYYAGRSMLYHGGPDIADNTLRRRGRQGQDAGGLFLTPDRAYAEQYSAGHGGKGRVYEVDAADAGKNTFDPRNPEHLERLREGFLSMVDPDDGDGYATRADALRDFDQVRELDLDDWAEGSQYIEQIEAAGFDSVSFKERPGKIGLADDGSFDVSGPEVRSVASFRSELPVSRGHKALVEQALAEGKRVPAKVLAEYPDLAANAKAPRGEAPRYTRDQMRKDWVEKFGLPKEQADAVIALTDARAKVWARLNDSTPEEYYARRFAGVVEGGTPSPTALQQLVFHGSPHRFERFDAGKIGTGEGGASYGRGLYFAGDRNVAQEYRKALEHRTAAFLGVNGQRLTPARARTLVDASPNQYERRFWEEFAQSGSTNLGVKAKKRLAGLLEHHREQAEYFRKRIADIEADDAAGKKVIRTHTAADHMERLRGHELALAALEPLEARFAEKPAENQGALYHVELPDEAIASMLDHDAPLTEQPQHVRDAITKKVFPHLGRGWSEAYEAGIVEQTLDQALANPKSKVHKQTGERIYKDLVDIERLAPGAALRIARAELQRVEDDRQAQYWAFTRQAKAPPVKTETWRRIAQLEGLVRDIKDADSPELRAVLALRAVGIEGVKYLDQFSRIGSSKSDTRNYVLFDDSLARVIGYERNSKDDFVRTSPEPLRQDSAPEPQLMALHNTTADQLLFGNRVGGFPAPSLAVLPRGTDFSRFGDITMIGDRSLVDPQGDPTNLLHNADIYSPRQPHEQHDYVKKGKRAFETDADLQRAWSDYYGRRTGPDLDAYGYNADKPGTLYKLSREGGMKLAFIRAKGQDVAMVEKPARTSLGFQPKAFDVVAGETFPRKYQEIDADEYARVDRAFRKVLRAALKIEGRSRSFDDVLKRYTYEHDTVIAAYIDRFLEDVETVRSGKKEVDTEANDKALDAKIGELGGEDAFKEWIAERVKPVFTEGYLLSGKKKVPYTAEAALDDMTSRKQVGSEKTMVKGLGAAKATSSKKLSSIEQARELAAAGIKSKADAETIYEQHRAELGEIATLLAKDSKFGSMWDAMDGVGGAVKRYLAGRSRTAEAMRSAFAKEGFRSVRGDVIDRAPELHRTVHEAPVEYFESKPQRVVGLGDFKGAVIPDDTPAAARKALEDAGVRVETYPAGDQAARQQAVDKFNEVFFQGSEGQGAKASVEFLEGNQALIRALEKPDVSSATHELGHVFLDDLRMQGGEDLRIAAEWAGVEGDNWQREHHEKWARGFERYLAEGKAPSPELAGVFEKFKQWIVDIYKTITGSQIDVKLSPEVRGVMDRLLAEAPDSESPATKVAQPSLARPKAPLRQYPLPPKPRKWKAGANEGAVRFASANHRDLFDLGTELKRAEAVSRTGASKPQKDVTSIIDRLATELRVSPEKVRLLALGVRADVTAQMKGLKAGETRTVKDSFSQDIEETLRKRLEDTVGVADLPIPGSGVRINVGGGKPSPPKPETPTVDVKFAPEQEEAYQASKDLVPRQSVADWIKEIAASAWHKATRPYEHLARGAAHAEFFEDLKELEVRRGVASDKAITHMKGLLAGFSREQYDLFNRKVVLDDLAEELRRREARNKAMAPEAQSDLDAEITRLRTRVAGIQKTLDDARATRDTKESVDNAKAVQLAKRSLDKVRAERDALAADLTAKYVADVRSKKAALDELRRQQSESIDGAPDMADAIAAARSAYERARAKKPTSPELENAKAAVARIAENLNRMRGEAKTGNKAKVNEAREALGNAKRELRKAEERAANVQARRASTDLAFGFDPNTLHEARQRVDAAVAADSAIAESVALRQTLWRKVTDDYLASAKEAVGFEPPMNRQNYFRNIIIENLDAKRTEKVFREAIEGFHATTNDPFTKRREATNKNFLSDYVRAEHQALSLMLQRTREFQILSDINHRYNVGDQLRRDHGSEWRDHIPEGYAMWQPKPGRQFHEVLSLSEAYMSELLQQGVDANTAIPVEKLQEVIAAGAKNKEWVIPEEVAATLDAVESEPTVNVVRKAVRLWKKFMLQGPHRFVKYNIRNITGDADGLLAANPKAAKEVPAAAKDLYNFLYRQGAASPDLKAWIELGGMQDLFRGAELGADVGGLKQFKQFYDKRTLREYADPRTWMRAYNDAVGGMSDAREALLRYALFRQYKREMARNPDGRPDSFGASIPDEVMAIQNLNRRAHRMSNDALGAYNELTVMGKYLRDTAWPFWSWNEVNVKRYKRVIQNAFRDKPVTEAFGQSVLKGAGILAVRSPAIAFKVGKAAAAMSVLSAGLAGYNLAFFADEEADLPEDVRKRPHMIFGRDAEGNVLYFDRMGAIGDALEWFGKYDDQKQVISDYMDGKLSWNQAIGQAAKNAGWTALDKVAQGLGPAKTIAELGFGQQLYPSIYKPRPIRDRAGFIIEGLGFGTEYGLVMGRPNRGVGRMAQDQFLYQIDPDEAAFNDIRSLANKFDEGLNGPKQKVSREPTDRSNALYYYKVALKYGDKKAAEQYFNEFASLTVGRSIGDRRELTGTEIAQINENLASAIEAADPLYGLGPEERAEFIATLKPRDRVQLDKAQKFWRETMLAEDSGLNELAPRDFELDPYGLMPKKKSRDSEKPTLSEGARDVYKQADVVIRAAVDFDLSPPVSRQRKKESGTTYSSRAARTKEVWREAVRNLAPAYLELPEAEREAKRKELAKKIADAVEAKINAEFPPATGP